MQPIYITDPAWWTSFPHVIAPLPDEWLPGLILRCDEVNHWGSGTTLALLRRRSPTSLDWLKGTERYIYMNPNRLDFDKLAQWLAITTNAVLATTYYFERVQLYKLSVMPESLYAPFLFHLCPECLAESRLLRRTSILPHITHCQQHQLALLNTCQCGSFLQLFHKQSGPFTCSNCGLDWADLSRIAVSPERLALEREVLLWYEFFFSKGTLISFGALNKLYRKAPSERKTHLLQQESNSVSYSCNELSTLGFLVTSLAARDLSPSDLEDDDFRRIEDFDYP